MASTLQMGPGRTYTTIQAAINAAVAGDTIEIDGGNTYAQTADITKSNLTIAGVGATRPIFDGASGINVGGQAIWRITSAASNVVVDNIEIRNATATNGIYLVGPSPTVRNCYIHDNFDTGIMIAIAVTGTITIEYNHLYNNGFTSAGPPHNIYDSSDNSTLIFRYNNSHRAPNGHLLKSRSRIAYILYNRLVNDDGTASYEIDRPETGITYIVGNAVYKASNAANSFLVEYGSDGIVAGHTPNLYIVNNTFVSNKANADFVRMFVTPPQPPLLQNNIFAGTGFICSSDASHTQAPSTRLNNLTGTIASFNFRDAANYDFRLNAGSPAINAGSAPGAGDGFALAPVHQFLYPNILPFP